MSNENFTKGKWVNGYGSGLTGPTTPNYPNPTVDTERKYIPVSINKQTIAIVIQPENNSVDEMNSNAKLISSAPEMYDALVSVEKYLTDLYESNELAPFPTRSELDRIRFALKKAVS